MTAKIAVAVYHPLPTTEAIVPHLVFQAQAMVRAGHEVTMLAPRVDRARAATDFGTSRVRYVERRARSSELFGLRAALWCRRQGVDLLYTLLLSAALPAATLGLGVSYECHTGPRSRARTAMETWLLRREGVAPLIVVSPAIRDAYARVLPAPLARAVRVLPVATIVGDHEPPAGGRARLTIGYAGLVDPAKGSDVLVPLARALPDHRFVVAGRVTAGARLPTDPPANLELLGPIPPGDVQAFLASCDILLAPYPEDRDFASPAKVAEALGAGRPLVVSDKRGARSVLGPGAEDLAVLVPPGDVEALVNAVQTLAADPGLRHRLGRRAHRYAAEHLSYGARAAAVLAQRLPTA